MKTKHYLLMGIALMALFALVLAGCEIGINPLLFDGSPVSAKFRTDATGTSYSGSASFAPHDILSAIDKKIDSIKVFNISLLIDSTDGTSSSNTISGTGTIDGHTLITLTNASISSFASERSIFDPALAAEGVTYGSAGISYLNGLLHDPGTLPSTMTVAVSGTASQSGLHFTVKVKIYTQVYTTP